jgi:hypothetical protein
MRMVQGKTNLLFMENVAYRDRGRASFSEGERRFDYSRL